VSSRGKKQTIEFSVTPKNINVKVKKKKNNGRGGGYYKIGKP
jgi:hypothetical protein